MLRAVQDQGGSLELPNLAAGLRWNEPRFLVNAGRKVSAGHSGAGPLRTGGRRQSWRAGRHGVKNKVQAP